MSNAPRDYSAPYQPLAYDTPEYQQFVASPELDRAIPVTRSNQELRAAFPHAFPPMEVSKVAGPGGNPMAGFNPNPVVTDLLRQTGSLQGAKAFLAEADMEIDHNTEYLLNLIGPAIQQVTQQGRQNGRPVRIRDLSNEQLAEMALAAGADPGVVELITASPNNPLRSFGLDLPERVRMRAVRYDNAYAAGEAVANNLPANLFGVDNPVAKAQAMRNYAYFRGLQDDRFFSDLGTGFLMLAGAVLEAPMQAATGVVEAAAGVDDVLQSISPAIADKPEIREEVAYVLRRAREKQVALGKAYDRKMANTGNRPPDQIGLELAREFAADPEVPVLMQKMDEYKSKGWIQPTSRFSRLYSVFDGGVKAIPEIWNMAAASQDPNGILFQMEVHADQNTMMGGIGGWMKGLANWWKGTPRYQSMSDADALKEADVLQENYNTARASAGVGGVEMFWRAVGFKKAADEAASLTNIEISNTTSVVLDPILIATVGTGAAIKAATKVAKVQPFARSAEATALLGRVESLANRVLVNPGFTPVRAEIDAIQTAARVVGVRLTDSQAVALALTDAAASPELKQVLASQAKDVGEIKHKIDLLLRSSDDLAQEAKAVRAEAKAYADAQPKTPTVAEAAPVAGAAARATGAAVEKTGRTLEIVSGLLGAPVAEGRLPLVLRRYVQIAQRMPGGGLGIAAGVGAVAGAAIGGPGGAIAGIGYAVGGGLAAPVLAALGSPVGRALARNGRVLKLAAKDIASGERQGTSLMLETARRLREESIAAKQAGKLEEAQRLLNDSNVIIHHQRRGLEKAMQGSLTLAWQGVVSSSTGALIAYANDSNAAGAGAGIGFGAAGMARVAATIHRLTPSGTALARRSALVADSLTLLSRMDNDQRAKFGEALEQARSQAKGRYGISEAEGVERFLDNYRLLHFATGGKVTLASASEIAAVATSLRNGEINVDVIRKMASEQFPNDPAAAATYAETLLAKANEDKTGRLRLTSLRDADARSKKEQGVVERKLQVKQAALAKATDPKQQIRIQDDISILEAEVAALKDEQVRYGVEIDLASAKLTDQASIISEADRQGLQGDARTAFIRERTLAQAMERDPSRAYEVLQQANGVGIQQIADGIYVNDTGQVFIDHKVANPTTYAHEAFEALLMHDAAQAMMPEMVQAMFGHSPSAPGAPGRKAPQMSRGVAMAFFDAYASDLTPQMATRYKAELQAAMDAFDSSGGKESSRLEPFVREAMSWWLAAIHDRRPIGYAKGIATPPGMTASDARGKVAIKPKEIWNRLMSDASWTDNLSTTALRQEFEAFFGPDFGVVGSRSRSTIYSLLQSNGMAFEMSSSGTVQGFFRREGTVRNPMMNEMYDRVLAMLGGSDGVRRMNGMNPFDATIPEGQRVAWARASGMDWLIGPDGNTILPPDAVANTVEAASTSILTALGSVDPANRGLRATASPDGTVVYTGRPTQAEVDAIANAPDVPETMRDNLRAMLQGLVQGETNGVLTGRYINVRTTQAGLGTEGRLVVGKDVGVVTGEKQFVPYGIVIGKSNNVPGGGKTSTPITAVRVKALDMGAIKGNRNTAFERGVLNKDGALYKDSLGNDLSAQALGMLFSDETAFWNATKLYIDHLAAAGEIDPAAAVAQMPQGMEPTAVMLARVGGVSLEIATRQRDAIRAILGLEARKGRVTLNPASSDRIIRDMNQTTTDLRLDALGRLGNTGEQWNINSAVITWSQFNMAPSTWRNLPDDAAKAFAARDEAWFTEEVLAHPNQPYVMTRDTQDGRVRWRAFDRETGDAIAVDGNRKADALLAVRQHMASKEWLAEALQVTETMASKTDTSPEAASLRAEGKQAAAALKYDSQSLAIRSEAVAKQVKDAISNLEREVARIGDTQSKDVDYINAIKSGNNAAAAKAIAAQAARDGFTIGPVYHGTPTGGFTKFDMGRAASVGGTNRGGASFTTNKDAATEYSAFMGAGASADIDLIARANKALSEGSDTAMLFDQPIREIEIKLENLDLQKGETVADAVSDIASQIEKSDPATAAKIRSILSQKPSNVKPEVKAVYLRISGTPRVINTTRANMANDLVGVRATPDQPVIVNLEGGEKIYYIGNPNDIRSADIITRGDNGEIIPPSARFSNNDGDIRGNSQQTVSAKDRLAGETIAAKQERERQAERKTQRKRNEELVADIERRALEAERRGESAAAETERILKADEAAQKAFAEKLRLDLEALQAAATSTVDNAAQGLVRVDEIFRRTTQLTEPANSVFQQMAPQTLANIGVVISNNVSRQTLTRRLFVFTKSSAGVPSPKTDIAAATRNSMGQVAKSYLGSAGANADLRAAQNYILSNEAGWVIHSHLQVVKGGNVGRVFTLYSPTKAQVMQTQEIDQALYRMFLLGNSQYKGFVELALEQVPKTRDQQIIRQEETARRILGQPTR